MAKCININHPDYIDLLQQSGLHEDILKAKISIWMDENGVDMFPSLDELGIEAVNEMLSKQDLRAAKILGEANLTGIYAEQAQLEPAKTLQEIAQQAQGIMIDSDGNVTEHPNGGQLQSLIEAGIPQSVIDKAIEMFPKPSQLSPISNMKSGVLELFESNPELANAVYEALGVEIKNFKLIPNNEKHPEDANTYDVIYNDEKIGVVALFEGKNKIIKGVKLDEKFRDKGLGKKLYKFLNLQANLQGGVLFSDPEQQSADARRLWNSLIKEGVVNRATADEQSLKFNIDYKQQAQQLYSQYLDTIFPESKVKDIVYHGTANDIQEFTDSTFNYGKGIYFTKDFNYATQYRRVDINKPYNKKGGENIPVLINTINPKIFKNTEDFDYNEFGKIKNKPTTNDAYILDEPEASEYVVFEPEQIHILGSKQDIKRFKSWVDKFNKNNQKLNSNIQIFSDNKQGDFNSSSLKDDDLALMLFNRASGANVKSIDEITFDNVQYDTSKKDFAFFGGFSRDRSPSLSEVLNQTGVYPEHIMFIGESKVYPNFYEILEKQNEVIENSVKENFDKIFSFGFTSSVFDQVKKELNNSKSETFVFETADGKTFKFPKRFVKGFYKLTSKISQISEENRQNVLDAKVKQIIKEKRETSEKGIKPVIVKEFYNDDSTDILKYAIELIDNPLIKDAVKNAKNIKVVVFSNKEFSEEGVAAWYQPNTNSIYIYEENLRIDKGAFQLLAHELIHGVTHLAINYDISFKNEIKELIKEVKNKTGKKYQKDNKDSIYGLKDEHEFLSEAFSNPLFKQLLESIEEEKETSLSLWQKFINAIFNLFNKTSKYKTETYKISTFDKLNSIIQINNFKFYNVSNINDNTRLANFISQKSQENNSFQQFQQSLNKPNTNPVLQGNQQEQVKKFDELQERLSNKEFIEGAKNAFESSEELQNVYYEATGVENKQNTIASTIFELEPDITKEKLRTIYNNYVALINRKREGKAISYDVFESLLKTFQVYKHKDTYIFGNYDINTATFITRINSSPSSKELLAEAIPNIVKNGLDFISFVPKDYADKLVRSGYAASTSSFNYNFKGEEMDKFAVASNPNVFKKIFNKSYEDVTSKEIEYYNQSQNLKYTPVEINSELIKKAGKDASKIFETYLYQFGITVKDINEIKDKLEIDEIGVADLLSKIAYIKDKKDLPIIAGEFIAYMMQYNPLVTDIITELSKTDKYKNLDKSQYFKLIGELVSQDLQNKIKGNYNQSLIDKIKELVNKFLELFMSVPIDTINTNIGIISNNVLQQNKKLITASLYKPGAFGKPTQQVNIEEALKKDKFGASIIYKLSKLGFILTGSTALSEQGVILRPDENPLHDIDWVSPFSRKETEEKFLKSYPNAVKVRDIYGDGYITDSYLITPEGYSISNYKADNFNGKIIINSYDVIDSKGNVVGTYRLQKQEGNNQSEEIVTGVEGKVIDFFSYENYSDKNLNNPFNYKSKEGTVIQLANWKDVFKAKLDFARYKDIWDYNRFIPNENIQTPLEQKQDALNAYTDYIARVSLGIVKNPSSGKYNYESKVKDIVYHQTDSTFDKFKKRFSKELGYEVPIYFSKTSKDKTVFGINLDEGGNSKNEIAAIVDSNNPIESNSLENSKYGNLKQYNLANNDSIIINQLSAKERGVESISNTPAIKWIAVKEPEQIHVLGSKQDIEGFKNWTEKNNGMLSSQKLLDNLQFKKGDC